MSDNYSCYEEYSDAMDGLAEAEMEAEAMAAESEAAAELANIEADEEELKEYCDGIKEVDMDSLTRKQRRFFALSHELGYEAMTVKERAKKYFKVEHFNQLTEEQLDELIGKLEAKKNN